VSVHIVVGAATDVGRVRDHNEDAFLVDDRLGLFAVADGMGGHQAGEVASAIALEALRAAVTSGEGIRDAVTSANDAVYEKSTTDERLRGMGTTLTAGTLAAGDTLLLGHVGDSRGYLLRDHHLERLTTDHSLVEELTVGRGGGCGIVLPDDHFVSTVHARVFRRGDDVFVEDLGSRNGTFVNGAPVASPIRLRRGDRVQFGETVAEVVR